MRIAISAEDDRGLESAISFHFGRCPYFVLVDVEDGAVTEVMAVQNPYYAEHHPGMVPPFIQSHDADVMVSGGMGRRAIELFASYGIQAATGASGTVQTALDAYLGGKLATAAPCRDGFIHKGTHKGHDH
jgi:predicted Fe-Mo cluster-binding NifX family protein